MAKEDLLRSWKDISAYLEVNARTCRRWEKDLGLPVHRIYPDSNRSPVFAYASELDLWLAGKSVAGLNRETEKKNRSSLQRTIVWAMMGLAVFIASAGFFKFIPFFPAGASPENLSIAVTPFENLNNSPQDEYFSEGITHEVINDLALFNNVQVFPALDRFEVKDSISRIQQIRSASDVDYLLLGGLRRSEGTLHLNVEIIRLQDNARILKLRLEEDMAKPFTIVNSLCQKISDSLGLGQSPFRRMAPPDRRLSSLNYNAFDAFFKGRYILSKLNNGQDDDRWKLYHQGKFYWGKASRESNDLATELFNQAITLDNSFADAYLGLAYCYLNNVNFAWDYQAKWLDKAEALIKKAQSLSPELPEYYSSLIETNLLKDVCFDAGTRTAAYKLADEGIRRYSHHPLFDSIVGYCLFMKYGENGKEEDFKKALEYKEKSYLTNPYSFHNLVYTELLTLDKQFEKAIAICETLQPHDSLMMALFRIGEIYYYIGDLEKSKAIMEGFESPLNQKLLALYYLGMIAAREGDAAKAEKIIGEIKLLTPADEVDFSGNLIKVASMYMGLGQKEMGYYYLDLFFSKKIAKKIPFIFKKYIDLDKNFDGCRGESEFCQIFEKGLIKWPKAKSFESLQISKNASKS